MDKQALLVAEGQGHIERKSSLVKFSGIVEVVLFEKSWTILFVHVCTQTCTCVHTHNSASRKELDESPIC